MADVVLTAVSNRIGTVTLNRPEARNALSREVRRLLPAAVAGLDADDDVDVIIVTGADPAFCAGLDLKELGAPRDSEAEGEARDLVTEERRRRGPFPPTEKPVIGAVNGVAVTGGLEVALACDFLVASERARFADTHARIGVMPGWGLTVLLAEAVGLRRAREMSATGNFVDAETALVWGLVNHVVAHDELLPFCRQLANDIASNDQPGVRRMMRTYDEIAAVGTGEDGWAAEARAASTWMESGGGSAEEVERRRRAVVDRGRRQVTG